MPKNTRRPAAAVTRRHFMVSLGAGLAGTSLLAACGGTGQVTTTSTASTPAATSQAATSAAAPASTAATSTVATTSQAAATSAAPAKAGGAVTVAYLSDLPDTHPEGKARLGLLAEFNTTNKDRITVNVDGAKNATSLDKGFSLAAAGTPPDLFYVAYYDAAALLAKGATTDLDAELRTEKDWTTQKADIFPDMLSSSTWAGKLAGMPCYTNNSAMIYSPQLLAQIGVTAPKPDWNWQDFQDLAQKGNKPPDRWGYDWNWVYWSNFLGTTGERPIDKAGQKITMTTPEAQDTISFLANLFKLGVTPPKIEGELFDKTKGTGVAFESQGPYRIPVLRQHGVTDFTVVPTPIKKTPFAGNGGHNLAVFKEIPADRKHASTLVALWLNSPHPQAQMCIQATSLPVSNAAFKSQELQDYLKTDPQLKGFIDLAPYGWRWPSLPSYAKITGAIQTNVNDIFNGKISVQDGLTKGQQAAQVLVDEDLKLLQ